MKRYVVLDKKVGETPLAAIQTWRQGNPVYADTTACYAGRLDPMASGKLLVLLGDECKRLRSYTNLDKEYEIEVLIDIASDSGDMLGIPDFSHSEIFIDRAAIARALSKERGAHEREYPAFSSKTVNGKPLFLYALEGRLSEIKIPTHVEHIYRVQTEGLHTISSEELKGRIMELLDRVPRTDELSKKLGEDFRVDAIQAYWKSLFQTVGKRNFHILRLRVVCASGTYMRSLAGRIGASLGTKALALSIKRTKIGNYFPIWGGVGWWVRTYYIVQEQAPGGTGDRSHSESDISGN